MARDPTLTKSARQLKLWGVGFFDHGPLDLDQVLSNPKVTNFRLRECLMQFIINLLACEEQLCKKLCDGDDSIRAIEESIAVAFELDQFSEMAEEGKMDYSEASVGAPDVASILEKLFALSPSVRRARQQQCLQLQEDSNEGQRSTQTETGWSTNFNSMETPIGLIFQRLQDISLIIHEYDKLTAPEASQTSERLLPMFETHRNRLQAFYDDRCKHWSLGRIERIIRESKNQEAILSDLIREQKSHPCT